MSRGTAEIIEQGRRRMSRYSWVLVRYKGQEWDFVRGGTYADIQRKLGIAWFICPGMHLFLKLSAQDRAAILAALPPEEPMPSRRAKRTHGKRKGGP